MNVHSEAKRMITSALITQSQLRISVNPKVPGVVAPDRLLKQQSFSVDIGLHMAVPIPDLDIGREGIRCTLSFNRVPMACWFPWDSIYQVVATDRSGGAGWADDAPLGPPLTGTDAPPAPATRYTQMRPPPMQAPKKPRPAWLKVVK